MNNYSIHHQNGHRRNGASILPPHADAIRAAPESDQAAIARLAALSPLAYDRVREAEAERLGVRVSTLDEQIRAARPRAESAESAEPGGAVELPVPEPWPEPVDGAALLDELSATFRRFAVLPDYADQALALWTLFSYAIEAVQVAPILALTSPEKRCGKSTVLGLLQRLTHKPLPASNITAPALFRAVEKWTPTLLVDEADSFLSEKEELRGILNSGHTRISAFVIRTVGDDYEPRRFSTWGAKAVALIGRLPGTLADRSIEVRLRRKLPGESVERLRHADPAQFERLARRCARFVADYGPRIATARPDLPAALNDRAQDNWEPLLALADLAGGDWPAKARAAALALSGVEAEAPSLGAELLADIRDVFERRGVDRIKTAELIEALCEDEEAPWATYNRGKPITPRQLAKWLKEFGILTNQKIRFGTTTARGYLLDEFVDAFGRYLPRPLHPRGTREQLSHHAASGDFQRGTRGCGVPDEKPPQPAPHAACSFVPHTDTLANRLPPSPSVTPPHPSHHAASGDFASVTSGTDVTHKKRLEPSHHAGCDGVTDTTPPPTEGNTDPHA